MVDGFWGVFGGRGRVVRFGLGVDSGAFVFDISNITVVVISGVGHGLDTAIGKSNLVRSSHNFAISGLLSVKLSTRVGIGNTVLESIRLRGLIIVGGSMVGCWGMVWGWCSISWGSSGDGDGNSHEGSKGSKTKHDK
jgi:hypothetical protein